MKVLSVLWFLVTGLSPFVAAEESLLGSACLYSGQQFNWGCSSREGHHHSDYGCLCANINWLQTVTYCIHSGSTNEHTVDDGLKYIAEACIRDEVIITMDQFASYYENATHYLRDSTPDDLVHVVNTTLRSNQTDVNWYYKKFEQYSLDIKRSEWFGWGLVFYWVMIITVATVLNLNEKLFGFKWLSTKKNNLFNKHIVIPSVYKHYHEKTFYLFKFIPLNFPNRLNSIVITVFVILCMISVGVGYCVTLPHPYFSSRWEANITLVSYRTDLMSVSIFPLIYLFGLRNNIFLPLTGIPFSTFNYYHRWCAYVSTVLAFIHSIIWTVYAIKNGGLARFEEEAYWGWGVAATVFMVILLFQSEKVLRDYMYEFFLVVHKILNVVFIVAMNYHLAPFGWRGWVWSMVAIWGFDRAMRIGRIIANGGVLTANLKDVGNDVIKLTVKKPKYMRYHAGTYAYFYFLSITDAWFYSFQSHPFTVLKDPEEDCDKLVIYFRVHKGITRKILARLMKSGQDSISCKILLEGPYGMQIPQVAQVKKNIVGVAGGIGISAVYPHLYHQLRNQTSDAFHHKLYWIINDLNSLTWFKKELQWLRDKGCEVIIVFTGAKQETTIICTSSTNSLSSSCSLEKNPIDVNVHYLHKRPDLEELVQKEIGESEAASNDVAFVSCGSSPFNDQFRYTVGKCIQRTTAINVELQEESYVW
ncbi:ferric/cupric-chelate reductase KNAG_0B02740 [Huiozyma naganishii CBS 8797]|uniref:ferric-chelate reductase (NADPH) n=1 Tax=Huiozyma naganishii (strain ATCC MYA-139 / BCRC 22969 / CBS 8797 / KCTC 17520 / NBRC 10181 / NCYC 3082 / Yp74L-3) TaxID=1071383 RepID=J7RV03_HUIN7|nr:hypothetical protein KNAG_0B02740 [Kazachstania naganishii CBS 8797]CCK68717.1 hypothetical protein KNAG_0B02740 [Kazachstania naganishii CBS 8797]